MSLAERLNRNEAIRAATFDTPVQDVPMETPQPAADPKREQQNAIAERVRRSVIERLHGSEKEPSDADVKSAIEEILAEYSDVINRTERAKLAQDLFNEVLGLGPLEQLLRDNAVTEIMVNGPRQIFVERQGKLILTDVTFRDDEHVMQIVEKIVSSMRRHVDEASPMVDARLKDGSRVNIIIPPLSLVGPVITIRKFSKKPFTINDLISFGSLTPRMASFLEACVKGNLNMMVSGGTGIKRPVVFPYLFHDPNCKRAGAIQFVRLVAACSVCAVNCVTTLCRISGGSALVALPGWGATTQLVTNGGWGAANLFRDVSV